MSEPTSSQVQMNGASAPAIYGYLETDAARDLSAFDDLPSVVRKALREAPFELSAEALLGGWDGNGGKYSANELVTLITDAQTRILDAALAEGQR